MELALKTTERTVPRGEQELVNAARRGDDRAFEQLYARYRDRVTAFINSKVRDHGRAEDISQEVFMAALGQLRSHDQHIAFKPWIFAIAKNACIDEFRRSARGHEVPVENDDDFPKGHRASLSIVPSPPAAIESKQRLNDLRGAFGGLSENHHRLLVMRELEGRSYDEIGTRLGMTRQMVESGLFRARRKLGAEYDELASGRRCEQVQTVIDTGAALNLRALGIKERRRLTQHLSHCEPCRHDARLSGIDETLLKPRSIRDRIAALLPFGGLWRWPRRRGGSAAARGHASGHVAASGATQAAGTVGSSIGLGQAAAAVAALAVAGAGGGIAIAHVDHGHRAPSAAHHIRTSGAASAGTGASVGAAAQTQAGSASGGGQSGQTFSARSSTTGSGTGPSALRTRTKSSGTNSPVPGQKLPAGGSGSATSTPGVPNSTSSSGSPTSSPLNATKNSGVQAPSNITAPVKKITAPVKNVTSPVTAPVKGVTAPVVKTVTAPVKGVTAPVVKTVTAPVKGVTAPVKGVAAPVVKTVTAPVKGVTAPVVKTVTAPVKSIAAPVKSVVAPVVKSVAAPVKSVVAPVVKSVAAPVKSVAAPVKSVTAPVVKSVTAPVVKSVTAPATTATNPVTSPVAVVKKVLGGL